MNIPRSTGLLLALMTFGCAGNGGPSENPTAAEWTEAQREAEIEKRIEARRQLADKQPARVPVEEAGEVTGEVPVDLLDAIRLDLQKRLGIDTTGLDPTRAESVNWNDGSLGCPRPGEVYTQAVTPGYHIIFEIGGARYDYRAKRSGFFLLCELPAMNRPGQPTQ